MLLVKRQPDDRLVLQERETPKRPLEFKRSPGQRVSNETHESAAVDAQPEQEWVGLMMEELNALGGEPPLWAISTSTDSIDLRTLIFRQRGA